MNVFILNAGRCGSMSFIRACMHMSNFSAGHETRTHLTGVERLSYPEQHIEADNRLSWFLGRLEQVYGDNAFYVHLTRDVDAMVESFARRSDYGIMKAYREGILMGSSDQVPAHDIARDYIDTVNNNIRLFLNNKNHKMNFNLESAQDDFVVFWNTIGARGDLESALAEWSVRHNASL